MNNRGTNGRFRKMIKETEEETDRLSALQELIRNLLYLLNLLVILIKISPWLIILYFFIKYADFSKMIEDLIENHFCKCLKNTTLNQKINGI